MIHLITVTLTTVSRYLNTRMSHSNGDRSKLILTETVSFSLNEQGVTFNHKRLEMNIHFPRQCLLFMDYL